MIDVIIVNICINLSNCLNNYDYLFTFICFLIPYFATNPINVFSPTPITMPLPIPYLQIVVLNAILRESRKLLLFVHYGTNEISLVSPVKTLLSTFN